MPKHFVKNHYNGPILTKLYQLDLGVRFFKHSVFILLFICFFFLQTVVNKDVHLVISVGDVGWWTRVRVNSANRVNSRH